MFRFDDRPPRKPYLGIERRRGERRKSSERREMIRFEPDKQDRRSGKDRRRDSWDAAHSR